MRKNDHFLPSNTPTGGKIVPSNTRAREEIEVPDEVKHGLQENVIFMISLIQTSQGHDEFSDAASGEPLG